MRRALSRFVHLLGVVLAEPTVLYAGLCRLNPRLWTPVRRAMPLRRIAIVTPTGVRELSARVADSHLRRAAGFQGASSREIEETLILFDWYRDVHAGIHMRNVPAPLDVAFVGSDGTLLEIRRALPSGPGCTCEAGPFRWMLEASAGFFERQKIHAGEASLRSVKP